MCVGTASSEGDSETQEKLSRDRSETLVDKVYENLNTKKNIPIYGFNFGQYKGDSGQSCSLATEDERRIVLVKISKRSSDYSDDRLTDFLTRKFIELATDPNRDFQVDIRNYSLFIRGALKVAYGKNH